MGSEKEAKRKKAGQSRTPRTTKAPNAPPPDPRWEAFVNSYRGNPLLDQSVIYALSEPLIDAILKEVGNFFSAEEERFERDLSRQSGGGFFLKRPIAYHPLPTPAVRPEETPEMQEMTARQVASHAQIRQMLNEDMEQRGRRPDQIENYWKGLRERDKRTDARRWGYAGWLVTHPQFCRERDILRRRWNADVARLGRFPKIPMSMMGETPSTPVKKYREFYADYTMFCKRWAIERLATWELPIPMRAELSSPSLYHLPALGGDYRLPALGGAGLTLFIPWYLLRDKDIKLDEVAEHVRLIAGPEQMKDWLDGKPKEFGHERFAKMLELYVYLEMCLKARYGSRLKRNTDRLDHAFGRCLCADPNVTDATLREAENIRKIRQLMNRRLRQCGSSKES